jgi:hypothetical protein
VLSYYLQPQPPFFGLLTADGLLPGLMLLIKALGFGFPFIVVNFKLMYATISDEHLTNQIFLHHTIDIRRIIYIFASEHNGITKEIPASVCYVSWCLGFSFF